MGLIHQVNQTLTKRYNLPRKRQKPLKGTAFSLRISQMRKLEGLTMTALSERIGVTPSYISLLEAGDRLPSRDIVIKLARVFVPPEDIDTLDELLVLAGLSPTRYALQLQQDDTRAVYRALLNQNPEDFKAFAALVRLLIRREHLQEAEDLIYEGMKRFQNGWQLQALMANLQLCLKIYDTAATFIAAATDIFQRRHPEADLSQDSDYADLVVNQGVIQFLWGMDTIAQTESAAPKQLSKFKKLAIERFRLALAFFEQALSITPKDIFLLDEYARISFNIADLAEGKDKPALWQAAIERFVSVLCAEDVSALGLSSVREANAYLAHAHSKSGQFDQARMLIGVIQSTHPEYWLIHYVRACYFSLRGQAENCDALQDQALEALQRALRAHHSQNDSPNMAPSDPDLAALRQARPQAFAELLKPHHP
ncbi:MAG: hypothetical protein CVV27_09095 [Candidatus Melainabacteria bacterium HGW-Melainabacteria-1]|nr:MAG: hypothetical protein CVV27_09095 [Candidatus Melainabacteria bacterium HGW-Melainabacteria-1]